jgi:mono/diheme cytochrome c family protein
MTRSTPILMLLTLGLAASVAIAGPKVDSAKGKAIYDAQCMICHGEGGAGDGPAGMALRPTPTDMTTAAWWNGKTDATIMASIRRGTPGTSMQAYNKMSREDLENLVAYLRGFEPNK